jgi:hypothetical protein
MAKTAAKAKPDTAPKEERVSLSIRVTPNQRRKLHQLALNRDIPLQDLIMEMVEGLIGRKA